MEELSQEEKTTALCDAVVLEKSPEKVAETLRSLGEIDNTAHALGLAIRFRGMEYVKALVDGGATFFYHRMLGGYSADPYEYWLALIDLNSAHTGMWGLDKDSLAFKPRGEYASADGRKVTVKSLPVESRVEIMRFLYENRDMVRFNPEQLLYYSILNGADKMTDALKKLGVKFSENRVKSLTETANCNFTWTEFSNIEANLSYDEYLPVMTRLCEELDGKPLHYTNGILDNNYAPYRKQYRLFDPKFFAFFLGHFNQKKMNKSAIMKGAINEDSVACLAECAKLGWLSQPRKRDEMIQYASDKGKTECTAWLLDFKNRTADLAAERERAEKRQTAELNAAPDSVMMMKKIWSYEKLEDGGIVIKRYKGNDTEIKVPEKIGKDTVVAIGDYAFSPNALRTTRERGKFLRTVKKITLPNTIKSIGASAFEYLTALETVNIPDGVEVIGKSVFTLCQSLVSMEFPDSVRELGETAFSSCKNLETVKLPSGIPEIGNTMFNYCEKLREIRIPESVKRIGAYAFNGCVKLSEIVLPEGVEEIGNVAFQGCVDLKKIVLPASLKSIKNYKLYKNKPPVPPFADAKDLKAFVAPKSYAEKYCKRNEIPYEYKEEQTV